MLAGRIVFAEHLPASASGLMRGLGFAGAVLGATLLAATGHGEHPRPAKNHRRASGLAAPPLAGELRSGQGH
jgi:hypothetical protein